MASSPSVDDGSSPALHLITGRQNPPLHVHPASQSSAAPTSDSRISAELQQQIDNIKDRNLAKKAAIIRRIIDREDPPGPTPPERRDWGMADPTSSQAAAGQGADRWPYQYPYDPQNSLVTQDQILLLHHWKRGGVVGLARQIRLFVEAAMNRDSNSGKTVASYKRFVDEDDEHPTWIPTILFSIDPYLIEPIIRGTLPSFLDDHPGLRSNANPEETAGVYLNYPCRVLLTPGLGNTASTQNRDPFSGHFVHATLLLEIYQAMESYMEWNDVDTSKRAESEKIAALIDVAVGRYSFKPLERRYCKSENTAKAINNWLDKIDNVYIRNIKEVIQDSPRDKILDIPMARVLAEAGWGIDVQSRVTAHHNHIATTQIFGLFTATLMALTTDSATSHTDWGIRTYQVLETPFSEMDSMSEITVHFLAGADLQEAGFNYHPPGGMSSSISADPRNTKRFKKNRNKVFLGPEFARRRRKYEETMTNLRDSVKKRENLPALEQAVKEIKETKIRKALATLKRIVHIDAALTAKRDMQKDIKMFQDYLNDL